MSRRFFSDQSGSAAAEMALMLPMLLVLMFGGFEAGHFIWTQHKLTEAVRDGARFASRMEIDDICGTDPDAARAEVRLLTRTGQLADANANPKVPGWTDGMVTVTCGTFVSTGLYADLGGAGPTVTVLASGVPYPSLFQQLGLIDGNVLLTAESHAAVIGI